VEEGCQVFPVVLPGLDRDGIFLAPCLAQLQQVSLGCFPGTGLIDRFEIGHEGLAIFPGHVLQAMPDLMNDAALDFSGRKNRMNGIFEAGQPINAGDENILDPTSLEVGDDTEPEVGPSAPSPIQWPSTALCPSKSTPKTI
jgi:hypothetical protein